MLKFSTEHEDIPQGKPIRASMRVLYVFTPVEEYKTHMVNVLNVNLKGSIPGFITSQIPRLQLDEYKNFKKFIEKE